MTFSEKAKFARLQMFMSQVKLVRELSVSFTISNRWEQGK